MLLIHLFLSLPHPLQPVLRYTGVVALQAPFSLDDANILFCLSIYDVAFIISLMSLLNLMYAVDQLSFGFNVFTLVLANNNQIS